MTQQLQTDDLGMYEGVQVKYTEPVNLMKLVL